MRILIVEDDSDSRNTLKVLLERDGHDVTSAPNGMKGWQAFEVGDYRVVLSDWIMPEMDGLELLQKVRSNAILRRTPFIIASAQSARDKISQALNAGASVYVQKPFTAPELRKALELALGRFV